MISRVNDMILAVNELFKNMGLRLHHTSFLIVLFKPPTNNVEFSNFW